MGTINPNDIPDDKLDAVIGRLQKEKEARIDARVEAGEAIRVNVDVVGDEDVEMAKMARARKLLRSKVQSDKPDEFWRMSPVDALENAAF